MARLTTDERNGLNVALNEAQLVSAELDEEDRRFRATLAVYALPEGPGPPDPDPRIQLNLHPVGRLAVSFRRGRWDNPDAPPVLLTAAELPSIVASFRQLPIYGWEFFDAGEASFAGWSSRLSLDIELGSERKHTLDLFQEGHESFIELRVWFSELIVGRTRGTALIQVPIEDVIAGGKRWWDAVYRNDPRTRDSGILPLGR